MSVYIVSFDGSDDVVEAKSMGQACEIWRAFQKQLDDEFDDEPEQVVKISEGITIRADEVLYSPHQQS